MGTSFQGDIAIDDVIFNDGCYFSGNLLPGKEKKIIFIFVPLFFFFFRKKENQIFNVIY